jgi:hypothetical protein
MSNWIGPNNEFIDRKAVGVVTESIIDRTWKSVAHKLSRVRKTADNNSRASNSTPMKLGIEGFLMDDNGNGGLTKGVAMVEQLLSAAPQEYFLLCIPRKVERSTNPLFEAIRKFGSRHDTLSSTYTIEHKGEHIQCPVQIQSNSSGPKMITGELDYIRAFTSNHNPCLVTVWDVIPVFSTNTK